MEPNFDKEIDALLRRTAISEQSPAPAANGSNRPHLDADEISAFAENALPARARQRYLVHLADCDPCRTNLSDLISLNSATAAEFAPEKEKFVGVADILPKIPWYRRLLATPNLAYLMGALVIFFAGITVFTVWQSQSVSKNVAQLEPEQDKTGASSDRSSSANAAAPASKPATDADGGASANTSVNSVDTPGDLVNKTGPQSVTVPGQPDVSTENKPDNAPRREDPADSRLPEPSPTDILTERSEDKDLKSPIKENKKVGDEIATGEVAPASKTAPPGPGGRKEELAKKKRDKLTVRSGTDEEAQEDDGAAQPTRQISGKTFKRTDGVWYDADYKNQATTNVRRGTSQYRSLDSGLRSIAEKLSGTIIVVWKTKAYRIQ